MKKSALKDGRQKSLEYSIKDGAAFSIMTGFGEQYFTPLAIELGASNIGIGLLASLPPFIASLPQLFTSKATEYLKSRKKTILIAVLLQILTWLPLAAIPLLWPENGVELLIFFVSLYFMFGQFRKPHMEQPHGRPRQRKSKGQILRDEK